MSIRRACRRTTGWCLVATLALAGCATAPKPIESRSYEDSFGGNVPDDSEITVESVQLQEMLHQRAQFEFRIGPSFTFDLFDPGNETHTDDSFVVGGKFAIEAAKHLFLGISADWAQHDVEGASSPATTLPIQNIDFYDRVTVLANIDYDIPLWDHKNAWVLRLGFGTGVAIILPESVSSGVQEVEDVYQIVFRPAVGFRWPFHDNVIFFTEAYYDIIPERSLQNTSSQRISGERPVFSNGAIVFGVAFQW